MIALVDAILVCVMMRTMKHPLQYNVGTMKAFLNCLRQPVEAVTLSVWPLESNLLECFKNFQKSCSIGMGSRKSKQSIACCWLCCLRTSIVLLDELMHCAIVGLVALMFAS